MSETILFTTTDGVARLTLNRPDRLNSFTVQMHQEVTAALATVEADESIRVLVLTGAGKGFCAGQDLNDRKALSAGSEVDLGNSVEKYYNPLIRRLSALRVPVICAVNGVAAGAGANIALCCDIVIAARSARFIESFAKLGLIPDSGGTWFLPRLAGQPRALGLALTGDPLSAELAAEWGLIWKCVADDQLASEVDALALRFAAGPTRGLAATKTAIRGAWSRTLDAQLDVERDLMRELGQSADYQEGVAAFLEKRSAVFTGR
jgi:2-(1,2-epoxy-1,2-dihydrophenyl)acetyl-CoA isomerase